jgi:hypothetical protein
MDARLTSATALSIALAACTGGTPVEPETRPPGAEESGKTDVLEAGAAAMQNNGPLAKMDVYLVGFHPMKEEPAHQMEAHHFCRQVNEDFAQCALFDGNTVDANLNGIEYIISEKIFDQLPAGERQYWHPHNAEILSGQLVAPNLPKVAEKELMKSKMNSYGKTWHTWHTRDGMGKGDALPLGPAMLAWSFNRDGEALAGLVEGRDNAMKISSGQLREERRDLQALAKPQEGVDVLRSAFPNARPIPGVTNKPSPATSQKTP